MKNLTIALAFAFTLVGCGGDSGTNDSGTVPVSIPTMIATPAPTPDGDYFVTISEFDISCPDFELNHPYKTFSVRLVSNDGELEASNIEPPITHINSINQAWIDADYFGELVTFTSFDVVQENANEPFVTLEYQFTARYSTNGLRGDLFFIIDGGPGLLCTANTEFSAVSY